MNCSSLCGKIHPLRLLFMLTGGKQLSQTFLFLFVVFFPSFLCLFSRQLSETRYFFHWRPHSFHSHARWLLVAMENPRNGADNSSMREQRLEGLEGGSKFLGPVLSRHQALLMCENGREDRVRGKCIKT